MSDAILASEVFPAELSAPAAARRFVVRAITGAGAEASDSVALVVSELVTNSVLHAGSKALVEVQVSSARVRVAVHDCDPTLPVRRQPGPRTVTGRGLMLVEALTDRWGAEPSEHGKVVWFELDR